MPESSSETPKRQKGKRPRRTGRGVKRLRGSYPRLEEQPEGRRRRQDVYESAIDDAGIGIVQRVTDRLYGRTNWVGQNRSDGENQSNTTGYAPAVSYIDQVGKEHDHCLAAGAGIADGVICDEDAADQFREHGAYLASAAMEGTAFLGRAGIDIHNLEQNKAMPKSTRNNKNRFNDDSNLIGAEGTRVGAFNQKRLRIAMGPRVYNNNVSAFTDLLNRSQRVHNEFALSYKAHENMRCWNMLHFRHMRHDSNHDDSTYRALAIPTGVNILSPVSDVTNMVGVKSPYIELKTVEADRTNADASGFKGDFYAPTSLVDLENLSYNLQGLTRVFHSQSAVRPNTSGTEGADYNADAVHSYKDPEHFAARSMIYKHNSDHGGVGVGTSTDPGTTWQRVIENRAHLVGGSVTMQFTNVSGQPALISLIVYKGKKTAASMQDFGEAAATGTSTDAAEPSGEDVTTSAVCEGDECDENPPTWDGGYPDRTVIGNPDFEDTNPTLSAGPAIATNGIGERVYRASAAGLKDRTLRAIALKDFKGDPYTPNDVSVNPRKKFLPKSTTSGDTNKSNPVSEHYRVSYILPGGATRAVNIDLPGALYDPMSAMFGQDVTIRSGAGFKNETSQINSHLYSIAVGVSGVRGLQQWTNTETNPATGIYGQGYGPANVQVKARYSETVGAMRVVVPKAPTGFGFNELQDTVGADPSAANMQVVTVLPQSMIVRTDDKAIAGKMDVDKAG